MKRINLLPIFGSSRKSIYLPKYYWPVYFSKLLIFDFATGSINFLQNILQNSSIVQKLKGKSRKHFGNSNFLEAHGRRIRIAPKRKRKIIK